MLTGRSSVTEVQHATSVLSNSCLLLTLSANRSHEQACGPRGGVLRTALGPTRKDLTPEGKKLQKEELTVPQSINSLHITEPTVH